MILVAVGTFVRGFDELVAAADEVSARLGLSGFAQIGHSRVIPRHLEWERFLAPPVLAQRLAASRLVICHGGIGLLGEAMRAGRPIIAVPRRGRPTKSNPAGDQAGLVCRLAEIHPIRMCADTVELPTVVEACLAAGLAPLSYRLDNDIPALVAAFLASTKQPSCGSRQG